VGRPIRIMHISDSFEFGGLERIVRNLAAQLDRRIYKFSACALDRDGVFGEEIRAMGLSVFVLGRKSGLDLLLPIKLYCLFRREGIEIVHTHNFTPLFYAALAARLAGVKVFVHTMHGRLGGPEPWRRLLAARYFANVANAITAVSPAVKQDLILQERIHPERIIVIPNGIDTSQPLDNNRGQTLRQEWNIPSEAYVVGTCCRLTAIKGVDYLLRAAVAIVARHPRTVFVIVGDGELQGELERLARELGLQDKVIFTGFRRDVPHILALLDVYALPSLSEGLSMGLLEAMLAGKPVVATRVGGNADVIEDGITGRLVEAQNSKQLADAIGWILSNPEEAKRFGSAAQENVRRRFSLERMVKEYDCLYQSLLAEHDKLKPSFSKT
jgi:sugar transferase (PEP-CTERM/EpsH1 system associated)